MTLLYPVWLLLIIPLALSLWRLKPPSRLLQIFRIVIIMLIILAMCGLSIKLRSRRGTVVVVADRSKSMPADAAKKQQEAIDLIHSKITRGDNLAVVSFGRKAAVEQSPQATKFPGFSAEVEPDSSNLDEAIRTALSLIPNDSPGRILVLSDGRWTGKDPASASAAAAVEGVPVDYRLLERSAGNDLAVYRIDIPQKVAPGESFVINAWVQSPLQQEISFQLERGSRVIASAKKTVSSGLTRLTFRDKAERPGVIRYQFSVSAGTDDPVPENNSAKGLLAVEGEKPLLIVTDTPQSGLAALLQAGQLNIQPASPDSCNWGLEDLAGFSAVILEDISAQKIGTGAMENLSLWVRETGAGLMMSGGKKSYGPGGYFKSALESIMPVSMELRSEHRKLSLAIVVALDRSGSMAEPVGLGKTKMDLANIASVQVLDLLSPLDEFGLIAVDSEAHTIVGLAPVERNLSQRGKILSIDSLGGGIFVFEALSNAARMLSTATPQNRHIILFADAADSEEPGAYKELLEKCAEAGITVSVVGLGTPADVDAKLLEDIAARGNGQCFFTQSADELPQLFAQDTFTVARSSFVEEPTPVQVTQRLLPLTGRQFSIPHTIGGYNLCYLRDKAMLGAVTTDEYKAPIVAAWQAGLGRVLCYTGQTNGPLTGDIAKWQDIGSFFSSLAKWTAGDTAGFDSNLLLTQEVQNGQYQLKIHLNPDRKAQPFDGLPQVTTLRGIPGKTPDVAKSFFQYEDADTLTAEIPLAGSETALSTVEVPGITPKPLPPVCLPYSPEYMPAEPGKGAATLMELARVTRGAERVNLANIWNDLPRQPQIFPMERWLLIVAIILLLLEVLERRTGLLSKTRWKSSAERITAPAVRAVEKRRNAARSHKPVRTPPPTEKDVPPETPAPEEKKEVAPPLLSALSKARQSARRRTDKNS